MTTNAANKHLEKTTAITNKRMASATEYIDELSDKYSRLNIVRVDLAYKKPYSDEITLERVNSDINRMLNNTRSKPTIFNDKVGYICKKEYTKDKGVHAHAIFIFNGQNVQNASFKADQIGSYWQNEITRGAGSYHNCNRNTYERNGIGMLEHKDKEKRKILDEDVVSYLCKDEQGIEALKTNKKDRAFTRGTLPKSKGNVGRPRSTDKMSIALEPNFPDC